MRGIFEKFRLVGRYPVNNFKNLDVKAAMSSSLTGFGSSVDNILGSSFRPLHFLCEDYSTKIGFLLKPIIHDVAPLTQIHQGPNPSLSQLNAVVSARRFSAMAKVHESPPQGTSASIYDVTARIKFKRLDKTAKNIMNILDKEAVEEVKTNREVPDIRPGYIVQLKVEVPENRRRVSIVKGIVIARRNAGLNSTFRLRRLVAGVGVESLFPLYSPNLKEIKVLDKKKVRRAKLYYLRDKMNALKRH